MAALKKIGLLPPVGTNAIPNPKITPRTGALKELLFKIILHFAVSLNRAPRLQSYLPTGSKNLIKAFIKPRAAFVSTAGSLTNNVSSL